MTDYSKLGKVGLCLAGGGARSITQAGMIKAFLEKGIPYHALFGVSAGALNGCLLHAGEFNKAEDLWMKIKTSDVYTWNPILDAWRPLSKESASIYNSDPLKKLLNKTVNYEAIKSNPVPFYINCSDYSNWTPLHMEVQDFLDREEFLQFLLASASPPVLFPKQKFRGSLVCDGGVVENFNLIPAVRAGCDTIIMITPTNVTHKEPNNAQDMLNLTTTVPAYAFRNIEMGGIEAVNKILDKVNESLEPDYKKINIITIKPPQPIDIDLLDFNYKLDRASLIQTGYVIAKDILERELPKYL